MFGLEFLFGAALWALPLAGVPLVLHLLFRRKSPIIAFSTLRFIKSSIQHTAARKKVQRWLLLACRALLLGLLIWAIAQPAKKPLARALGAGSVSAAIVVDTSYSMEYQDGPQSLLDKANDAVQNLLRGPLRDAQVALFRSQAEPADQPETFASASSISAEWTTLKPTPSPSPLVDQVQAAMDLLKQQGADHKQIYIISDLQSREFVRPIPDFPSGQILLLDLHPTDARSVGVMKVTTTPSQPLPGIVSQAEVEVSGHSGDVPLTLSLADPAGNVLATLPMPIARLDANGRAAVRAPIKFTNQPWQLLSATAQANDAMDWARSRTTLVQIPPPRPATVLQMPQPDAMAQRVIALALDPTEGAGNAWPIKVRTSQSISGDEAIVAAALTQWPDADAARRMLNIASGGGSVVLFLQPGLESDWAQLSSDQKTELTALLPGPPLTDSPPDGAYKASFATTDDPLLSGLSGEESAAGRMVVRRYMAINPMGAGVSAILNVSPLDPSAGSHLAGLLFRKQIGTGCAYTWTTLPDSTYGNLPTSELFLPMMVNTSLRASAAAGSANVELGQPVVLSGHDFDAQSGLEIESPSHQRYRVNASDDSGGRRFVFRQADEPGLYAWHKPNDADTLAYSNVQYPSDEAVLQYRESASVAPAAPNVVVARSFDELESKLDKVATPEPRWSLPIALVLLLLCLEALMASTNRIWKAALPRFFVPKMPAAPAV